MSSQAFNPTPKDSGLLSVYDGTLMTAEASFHHYTTTQGLKAVGTVSVSADEVVGVGLSWRPDPEPFPEHAIIDYTALGSASKMKAKAQALAERARARGWTYGQP
ncbi:hypothetical protein [uncultured Variovorax sp.]|uniref:hypothetical protein n=1 Tax=uncultured Variovorax sp. TaxID=114708 RepID=UPI002607149C|nr:hypothetical protein [uncultured Variovorax sp.]